MSKKKIKSLIEPYAMYIIIIFALYFVLISKRIKQNKEKDILEDTKEKSIDEIKKIIPYYKTNKRFLRKLTNNENKITIQMSLSISINFPILSILVTSIHHYS